MKEFSEIRSQHEENFQNLKKEQFDEYLKKY